MLFIIAKVKRVRGSLMVPLPQDFVERFGIGEGDVLRVMVGTRRKSYFGALKGIGSFEEEPDTHF